METWETHKGWSPIYCEETTHLSYLSPSQESKALSLRRPIHRMLPQTRPSSLAHPQVPLLPPPPPSGGVLLQPSSSLWSPQSLSPSHCHCVGMQVHSPRALTAQVKWLRPQAHSGLLAWPGHREKEPARGQLPPKQSPFQGRRQSSQV